MRDLTRQTDGNRPFNRVKTGRLRPLSSENDKSIKTRVISLFDAVTLRDGDTVKGFVTKSLYTDEFCRVVTSSFDAGIHALSTIEKNQGSSLHTVLFHPVTAHTDPTPAQARLNATHSPICAFEEKVYLASWTKLWLTLDEL